MTTYVSASSPADIKVFRESFAGASASVAPMIDELSQAERRETRRTSARYIENSFDPSQAAYYANAGDAIAAGRYRRAHAVLDRFSDVLLAVAGGANVNLDEIENLANETTRVLNEFPTPLAAGTDAPPRAQVVFDENARRNSRALIDAAVKQNVIGLLTAGMTDSTPQMFDVLVSDTRARTLRRERVRVVLANYVVVLNRMNEAWTQAARTTLAGQSIGVAVLADRVAALRMASTDMRRAYAELGATPR